MDLYQIELIGLRFHGYHGALKEEQALGQEFQVDLWLEVKTPRLGRDQVEDVVNYGQVALQVKAVFDAKAYHLLEALADAILADLAQFTLLHHAKIRICKPNAPIPLSFDHVAVIVQRSYPDVP